MKEIKGICPIIAAPFDNNGAVDYEDLYNLVKTLIKGGCNATTLFGIAGEYYKLSDDERNEMAKVCVEACKDNNGMSIISVTDHSTENALKQAKKFEKAGADCLMILPPFFLKPGQAYLYEHIKAISNCVDLPIMVQYAPEQTGVAIAPEFFLKLSKECPNIKYYKIECKPAGPYISNLKTLSDNNFNIFVGNAGFQLIECLDRGAIGAMPGCSMFDIYKDIYTNYINGNRTEAIQIHNSLLPMLNHIRQNVEQIIMFEKRILKKRGIIKSDYCRKPSYNSDIYFDKLFDDFYCDLSKKYNWR